MATDLGKDESQNNRELFLDTTYILPFFQVPITLEGFELSEFKTLIANLSRVHLTELSVYEAKAKLLRLSKVHRRYEKALRVFGQNLNVLRLDEKFVFHSYTSRRMLQSTASVCETLKRLQPNHTIRSVQCR